MTRRKTTWPAGGTEATSGPVDMSGQPPLPEMPGLGARAGFALSPPPRAERPAESCSVAAPPQASGVCGPYFLQVAVVRDRGPRREWDRRSSTGRWPHAQEVRGRAGCRLSSSDPDSVCSSLSHSCLDPGSAPEGLHSDQSLPIRAPWETLATGEKPDRQRYPQRSTALLLRGRPHEDPEAHGVGAPVPASLRPAGGEGPTQLAPGGSRPEGVSS